MEHIGHDADGNILMLGDRVAYMHTTDMGFRLAFGYITGTTWNNMILINGAVRRGAVHVVRVPEQGVMDQLEEMETLYRDFEQGLVVQVETEEERYCNPHRPFVPVSQLNPIRTVSQPQELTTFSVITTEEDK